MRFRIRLGTKFPLPEVRLHNDCAYPITTSVVDDSSVWQVRSGGTPRVAWNGNWADRVRAQVVLPSVSVGPVQKQLRGTHISSARKVRVLNFETVGFAGFAGFFVSPAKTSTKHNFGKEKNRYFAVPEPWSFGLGT
jgi:hypothetical protein